MDRSNQKASTPACRGKFKKVLLGLGVVAVAGAALSAAPAMAHERFEDRGQVVVRHEEFRHDRVWVPARFEFRTRVDCGRTVCDRVCVEAGHWVIR